MSSTIQYGIKRSSIYINITRFPLSNPGHTLSYSHINFRLNKMSSASSDHNIEKPGQNHAELLRQMTVSLSPEQYERLFFQPTAAKGDLAKRLGTSISAGYSLILT